MNKLILGNSLEKLKELEDNSIDSIVTDPPYELGFMGKSWDNTGIANNPDLWRECLRVLKPGGHLLAFSGTRTYHRMAVAIEDAGFEVRDMIEWVYGSGFPKSLDVSKAIDKAAGAQREVVGQHNAPAKSIYTQTGVSLSKEVYITAPSTDAAKQWEGWGTALKPSHEPICMARKPISEKTVAQNVLKYGTGGINIDESRVENTGKSTLRPLGKSAYQKGGGIVNGGVAGTHEVENEFGGGHDGGRFPANLIHDNSDKVKDCFPETKSSGDPNRFAKTNGGWAVSKFNKAPVSNIPADSGSASRFFKSIIYNPKASKAERNKGCENLDIKQNLQGLDNRGRTLEREDGSKTLVDRFSKTPAKNNHPTVKPIALMEYLIKMITPKGGTVLDPFMGSGSTGVAAKKNNYNFIGIDMTPEYLEIAKARINATEIENTFI